MERVCFTLQVRPERLEDYGERHAAVWPERYLSSGPGGHPAGCGRGTEYDRGSYGRVDSSALDLPPPGPGINAE